MKRRSQLHLLANLALLLSLIFGPLPLTAEGNSHDGNPSGLQGVPVVHQDAVSIEAISVLGGPTYAVAVAGNLAYIGAGNALAVLDITSPAHPAKIGQSMPMPDWVRRIALTGNNAFVAAGNGGLFIFDVSDPRNPVALGSYDTPGQALGVAVAGSYAYVADSGGGLRVIDVANPTEPKEVGSYKVIGMATFLVLVDNYAYIASNDGGLCIIDISDPSKPGEIGVGGPRGRSNGVAVAGNYAYVADFYEALRVLDVSDPLKPSKVGSYPLRGETNSVTVAGSYAYVADGTKGLEIIDIANPGAPAMAGTFDSLGYASSVVVSGTTAYLADAERGLRIIDIGDKSHPKEIGSFDGLPQDLSDVVIAGKYAYVTDSYGSHPGLRIVDLSNRQNPVPVGYFGTEEVPWHAAVSGNYAYLSGGCCKAVHIVDVADPAHPHEVGFFAAPNYAPRIAIAGNYAYTASCKNGLRVMNIADPSHPNEVGTYEAMRGTPRDIKIKGKYVYATDDDGLHILDIANPAKPAEIASMPLGRNYWGGEIALAGDYAYLAISAMGLRIVDVSDPAKPREAGYYPMDASNVTVADGLAYVCTPNGLYILDVSNPATPRVVGSFGTGSFSAVALSGGYIYATNFRGLWTLRFKGAMQLVKGSPVPADWDFQNGHFYTQGRGSSLMGYGYAVTDDRVAPFWSEFKRLGGVDGVGYPISRRFLWNGFISQAFQKGIFQWRPEAGKVYFVNVFDELSRQGKDGWMQAVRSTPPPGNFEEENLDWEQIVEGRLQVLDAYPEIKQAYFSVGDWMDLNGLPMAEVADYGNVRVLRAQRVVIQQWLVDVPWATAGQVVFANCGDVAREAKLFPLDATEPELWYYYKGNPFW